MWPTTCALFLGDQFQHGIAICRPARRPARPPPSGRTRVPRRGGSPSRSRGVAARIDIMLMTVSFLFPVSRRAETPARRAVFLPPAEPPPAARRPCRRRPSSPSSRIVPGSPAPSASVVRNIFNRSGLPPTAISHHAPGNGDRPRIWLCTSTAGRVPVDARLGLVDLARVGRRRPRPAASGPARPLPSCCQRLHHQPRRPPPSAGRAVRRQSCRDRSPMSPSAPPGRCRGPRPSS